MLNPLFGLDDPLFRRIDEIHYTFKNLENHKPRACYWTGVGHGCRYSKSMYHGLPFALAWHSILERKLMA